MIQCNDVGRFIQVQRNAESTKKIMHELQKRIDLSKKKANALQVLCKCFAKDTIFTRRY
jgi:hypothetical protein